MKEAWLSEDKHLVKFKNLDRGQPKMLEVGRLTSFTQNSTIG